MLIKELWRYPVKSMAGEPLDVADLTAHGIAGDRIIQVRNASGRIFSARTRPELLRHKAMLTATRRNHMYGCSETGYIVVPERTSSEPSPAK